MPTRQIIKTTATDSLPQQQAHAVLSNNNNLTNSCDAEKDVNYAADSASGRMKMPAALREVDELVNEIKLNLRLRGNNNATATSENFSNSSLRLCCCGEDNKEAVKGGGGAGGSSLFSMDDGRGRGCARGKVKSSRAFGGLARIQGAPYYVQKTSSCLSLQCALTTREEEENHLKSCQKCQLMKHRRHNRATSSTSDDPYQLLQELLKEGGLIKEAVRRLNFIGNDEDKLFDYDQDDYEPSSTVVV